MQPLQMPKHMKKKLNSGVAINILNLKLRQYTPLERLSWLYQHLEVTDILLTSSFGTQSALLLYWVSKLQPRQQVHFLDTGYHFEETLAYKQELSKALELDVIDVYPDPEEQAYTQREQLWKRQPDACCHRNKVSPLQKLKSNYKLWISGLMAYQTPERSALNILELKGDIIKFYPLLDLSECSFQTAFQQAALPRHPLQKQGYASIGCTHCTACGKGRNGRWAATNKTECGLHL